MNPDNRLFWLELDLDKAICEDTPRAAEKPITIIKRNIKTMKITNLTTNGGENKRKYFTLKISETGVTIIKQDNKTLEYSFENLLKIISEIHESKGVGVEVPLANAVDRVKDDNYQYGLGRAFYTTLNNTTLAQGASYIGPVLAMANILRWDGKTYRAKYSLQHLPQSECELRHSIISGFSPPGQSERLIA